MLARYSSRACRAWTGRLPFRCYQAPVTWVSRRGQRVHSPRWRGTQGPPPGSRRPPGHADSPPLGGRLVLTFQVALVGRGIVPVDGVPQLLGAGGPYRDRVRPPHGGPLCEDAGGRPEPWLAPASGEGDRRLSAEDRGAGGPLAGQGPCGRGAQADHRDGLHRRGTDHSSHRRRGEGSV